MKILLIASLFISANTFAQTITQPTFKSLVTAKKASLEKVNAGMTKKVVGKETVNVDGADCVITKTSTQTILKVQATDMIIFSQEVQTVANTQACKDAGYTALTENVIYFAALPTLATFITELDEASPDIRSLSKSGDVVTMVVDGKLEDGSTESVTMKYDISKSAFRNLISFATEGYSETTVDAADLDVNKIDLSDVYLCNSNKSEDCARGNYSDILF